MRSRESYGRWATVRGQQPPLWRVGAAFLSILLPRYDQRRHFGRHRRRRAALCAAARGPPAVPHRCPRRKRALGRQILPRGRQLDYRPAHPASRRGDGSSGMHARSRGALRLQRGVLGARRLGRRRAGAGVRARRRRRHLERQVVPDAGRRAAAHPGSQPRPHGADRPAGVAGRRRRAVRRLHRHQPQLLDGGPRDGDEADPRRVRHRGRARRHDAGAQRGRLPRRPRPRHRGQRGAAHRRGGGQAGDRAQQAARPVHGQRHRAGRPRHLGPVQPRPGARRPHGMRLAPAENSPPRPPPSPTP